MKLDQLELYKSLIMLCDITLPYMTSHHGVGPLTNTMNVGPLFSMGNARPAMIELGTPTIRDSTHWEALDNGKQL